MANRIVLEILHLIRIRRIYIKLNSAATYANSLKNFLLFELAGEACLALRFRFDIAITEQSGQTGERRTGRFPDGGERASVTTKRARIRTTERATTGRTADLTARFHRLRTRSVVTRLSIAYIKYV